MTINDKGDHMTTSSTPMPESRPRVRRSAARLMPMLVAGSLLLVACGSGGGQAAAGELSGSIEISGSSTVEPISTWVAEEFELEQPDVRVNVDGPGTGDGFALFCDGETDISNASRPIKPAEAETCADNGIEFIELKVAIDGLSVITNSANTAVGCLALEDLYALLGPESQGVNNWSGAQELAAELGSGTAFPDAVLSIAGPGEESGTYDSFIELALAPTAKVRADAGEITEEAVETTRPDYVSQSNDNVIIQTIEGSANSLGWVGYAFADQADGVSMLKIRGADGTCVAPTQETIASGEYPLARDLYIYVNADRADDPAVAAFVDFYVDNLAPAADAAAYVKLDTTTAQATSTRWMARTVGTVTG
jgi:phosphate transport system substrate-binding protein